MWRCSLEGQPKEHDIKKKKLTCEEQNYEKIPGYTHLKLKAYHFNLMKEKNCGQSYLFIKYTTQKILEDIYSKYPL